MEKEDLKKLIGIHGKISTRETAYVRNLHGCIIEAEDSQTLFKDNHDQLYLLKTKDIKEFIPMEISESRRGKYNPDEIEDTNSSDKQ